MIKYINTLKYVNPVELWESPGKGNPDFTTENPKAPTLLEDPIRYSNGLTGTNFFDILPVYW
jgi:hypothetical protein